LHVLIISQLFPPDLGGGATRAFNVAKGLKLNNVDVTVIAAFPHYPSGNVPIQLRKKALVFDFVEGIRTIRTWVPPLESKGIANRLILFLSFIVSATFALPLIRRPSVIFASNPQVLCIFPALLYKLIYRACVVLNVDDLWPEDPIDMGLITSGLFKKLAELVAKFAYTVADLITPISPGYIQVICGKYGIPRAKVAVVRGGVDLTKFRANAKERRDGRFTVLYTGAFSVAYDFDQVLKAAKLLQQQRDILFILQGKGELATVIKSKVKALAITNVKIIDEALSRDQVAELMGEADVLLLPLRDFGRPYLGISTKLYEYQAVGKPIICCAEGQPAEYVAKTGSGIVVRPGDFKALAEAVLSLKNNGDASVEYGQRAQSAVRQVSLEAIGNKLRQILMAKASSVRT